MRKVEYRFYSFVAGLYLSELQKGLQTAHAVSEMYADISNTQDDILAQQLFDVYDEWAQNDKTIIILNALNSAGVENAFQELDLFGCHKQLPVTIFHEDEVSLNNAATATGIILPDYIYNAELFNKDEASYSGFPKYVFTHPDEATPYIYERDSFESRFITLLKGYRLA